MPKNSHTIVPLQRSSESSDFILDANGMFHHCDALNFDVAYQKMKGNSSAGSLSFVTSPDASSDKTVKHTGTFSATNKTNA